MTLILVRRFSIVHPVYLTFWAWKMPAGLKYVLMNTIPYSEALYEWDGKSYSLRTGYLCEHYMYNVAPEVFIDLDYGTHDVNTRSKPQEHVIHASLRPCNLIYTQDSHRRESILPPNQRTGQSRPLHQRTFFQLLRTTSPMI